MSSMPRRHRAGKARVAAERALHSVGLAGDGLMVASSVPGIFLQGLAVYGRGGAEIPGKSLSPSVVAAAFEWAAREGVPLVSFHGDECRPLRMTLELEQLHTGASGPRMGWAGAAGVVPASLNVGRAASLEARPAFT